MLYAKPQVYAGDLESTDVFFKIKIMLLIDQP